MHHPLRVLAQPVHFLIQGTEFRIIPNQPDDFLRLVPGKEVEPCFQLGFYIFILRETPEVVKGNKVQDPLAGPGAGFGSSSDDIFLTESLRNPAERISGGD